MSEKKNNEGISFEENIELINKIIKIQVSRWSLKGLAYMDKDDVASEIREHIYVKFHLYDQNRPLGNWLTTTVGNKLKNMMRDKFYKFSPPCLSCPAYLGAEQCRIFGSCNNECGLYKKWEIEKKSQYNIELPLSQEFRQNEINSMPWDNVNIEEQLEELKIKLKERLTKNEFEIFCYIYLEKVTETEILTKMKFINKTDGIRQIKSLKQSIVGIVKNIIKTEELF